MLQLSQKMESEFWLICHALGEINACLPFYDGLLSDSICRMRGLYFSDVRTSHPLAGNISSPVRKVPSRFSKVWERLNSLIIPPNSLIDPANSTIDSANSLIIPVNSLIGPANSLIISANSLIGAPKKLQEPLPKP
jgi:hypothetical protein